MTTDPNRTDTRPGIAPIVALVVGLLAAYAMIGVSIYSPTSIPIGCAVHERCLTHPLTSG